MPPSIGVGRRHKRGTGNSKQTPHKRKICCITKQPESSSLLTSSSKKTASIVTSNFASDFASDFPTMAAMAQQSPKKIVTPSPPPTADSTTSLVVEFYKEDLHTIVYRLRNKMQYHQNKSATTTTKNIVAVSFVLLV